MATRNGSAEWHGDLEGGDGQVTIGDGAFQGSYTYKSRFEEGEGTNPEELVAGAQASCYAMYLSHILALDGHTPESVRANARVHLREVDGAPTIAKVELETTGSVPGVDEAEFQRYADRAKAECPVSRALGAVPEVELTARLA
jgi:lipoyl-dependent peroxiredoxin